MSTLPEVWKKMGVEKVNREGLKNFLQLLSIEVTDEEVCQIFTMLDIENSGKISYDDIRIFLKMTKVYDKAKYPKMKIKRRSSYKIHPE